MAKRVVEEEEIEEQEDETPKRRAPGGPRISITLPGRLRKKIRLAAALADMEQGEWAKVILVTAAKKVVEKHYPDMS